MLTFVKKKGSEINMGGMFSSPPEPKMPEAEIDKDEELKKTASKEIKKQRKRRGLSSTILSEQTQGTTLGG